MTVARDENTQEVMVKMVSSRSYLFLTLKRDNKLALMALGDDDHVARVPISKRSGFWLN